MCRTCLGCPWAGPALCPVDRQHVQKVHVNEDGNFEALIASLEQKCLEYGVRAWADVSDCHVRRNRSRKMYGSLAEWKFSSSFRLICAWPVVSGSKKLCVFVTLNPVAGVKVLQ